MPAKFLITPSLLNSFAYFMNYDEAEQAAKYGDNYTPKTNAEMRAEFLKTLSREKFEPNEAMKAGIHFEEEIKALCDGVITEEGKANYKQPYLDISEIVKGGIWQTAVSKSLQLGSIEYLLYGKTDVMKEDIIYDIKFTTNGSNYDVGKYQNSAQHRIYLYCSSLPRFAYLISDGKSVWREDYGNHEEIEDDLKEMISDFMHYLKSDSEAAQLYFGRWNAK